MSEINNEGQEEPGPDTFSQRIDELLILLRHLRLHQLSSGFSDYIDPDWNYDRKISAAESRWTILENRAIQKWNEIYALESRIKEREAYRLNIENQITQRLEELKSLEAGIENKK